MLKINTQTLVTGLNLKKGWMKFSKLLMDLESNTGMTGKQFIKRHSNGIINFLSQTQSHQASTILGWMSVEFILRQTFLALILDNIGTM